MSRTVEERIATVEARMAELEKVAIEIKRRLTLIEARQSGNLPQDMREILAQARKWTMH